jgi:hypothetical protein
MAGRGTNSNRNGYMADLKAINAAHMSDSYIIEVSSQAAGIVVRDRSGFRFFAASERFRGLEGQVFRSARAAERAASQYIEQSPPRAA